MEARVAGERPSPIGCVVRRCVAKAADVTLFGGLSYLVALLLLQQPLRFDGFVPACLSTLWGLGFIISADIAFALVFGVTPGELLAGIRVVTVEEKRLTFSQWQDRTTDALVEGTVGLTSLLPAFWRLEPAPYDKGCIIYFAPFTPQRILTTGMLVAASLGTVAVAGVVLQIRGFESTAPLMLTRVLKTLGADVSQRWINPLTGYEVVLPRRWEVVGSMVVPMSGEFKVELRGRDTSPGVVWLVGHPGLDFNELDGDTDASPDNIARLAKQVLGNAFDEATSLDARTDLTGDRRLVPLYSAYGVVGEGGNARFLTAIVWFTERRHTWVVGISRPRDDELAHRQARELALGLIRSTATR